MYLTTTLQCSYEKCMYDDETNYDFLIIWNLAAVVKGLLLLPINLQRSSGGLLRCERIFLLGAEGHAVGALVNGGTHLMGAH